jgi:hypothetical protein
MGDMDSRLKAVAVACAAAAQAASSSTAMPGASEDAALPSPRSYALDECMYL